MAEEKIPKEEVKKETKIVETKVEAPKETTPTEIKVDGSKEETTIEVPKEEVKKEDTGISRDKGFDKDSWTPKTQLGKRVKSEEIKTIDEILDRGLKILEPQIVDMLVTNIESDLISIGQSKGKFGGGKRSIWRQTQKKTSEGNKPSFSTLAVIGNRNGLVGVGYGKSKETVPAREKAIRKAKLNIIKIRRGCGSWLTKSRLQNSIPFKVEGKCGSVSIQLIPAPTGTGLCVEKECAKVLTLAGIEDVYSKTRGHTKTKINLIKACMAALEKLHSTKVNPQYHKQLGIEE
jgi:small subunit ribosomal protein S5